MSRTPQTTGVMVAGQSEHFIQAARFLGVLLLCLERLQMQSNAPRPQVRHTALQWQFGTATILSDCASKFHVCGYLKKYVVRGEST